ncbi:hypothetical protein [uncultured Microbulbifer sp.]|uniref:hypothetical protein n=1 Tax=uncultured Microbulbifer sp. TaxID=348147 RepID=UPI002630A937|nr:hypothetical protein [uncultured Microbulbifer sp.]
MAKISSYNFAGEMPRIDPKLLGDRFATRALNVELRRGQIAPATAPAETGQTLGAATQTLSLFNREGNEGQGFWLEFVGDMDVVRGQIAGDTSLRTYYTGDGVPKITDATLATGGDGPYPSAAHDLGLPAPSGPPDVSGPDGEPPEGGQVIDTAYIVTFVSSRGEEGPPTAPSRIVQRWDGAAVEVTAIPVASGNFIVHSKRIYRAQSTGGYQFVAEIPAGQTDFSDSVESEQLGGNLPQWGLDCTGPDDARTYGAAQRSYAGGLRQYPGVLRTLPAPRLADPLPTGHGLRLRCSRSDFCRCGDRYHGQTLSGGGLGAGSHEPGAPGRDTRLRQ